MSTENKTTENKAKRVKGFRLLITGIALFIASLALVIYARDDSYQKAKYVGYEIDDVKSQIKKIKVQVNKKMSKADFKRLKNQLKAAGMPATMTCR